VNDFLYLTSILVACPPIFYDLQVVWSSFETETPIYAWQSPLDFKSCIASQVLVLKGTFIEVEEILSFLRQNLDSC